MSAFGQKRTLGCHYRHNRLAMLLSLFHLLVKSSIVKQLSEKDWENQNVTIARSKATALIDRSVATGGDLLKYWLILLYREYTIGSWNRVIPNPEELEDQSTLLWDNEEYCIFHKNHSKFGRNIIEAINPHILETFVFFDYSCLTDAFEVFDKGQSFLYIPTYYAKVEDRSDYINFV